MASSGAVFSIVHEYYAMQSFTDGKIELTSAFSLLHHAHSFIFPFIHSFIHWCIRAPFFLQSMHPLFHPSCHSFVHTSSPGSLRQEVLQLQLSSKASLKGNSSDPWPQLRVQLEACPEALEPHSSAWCNPSSHCHAQLTVCFNYSQLRWKVWTLPSLISPAHTVYSIDWLVEFPIASYFQSSCMSCFSTTS